MHKSFVFVLAVFLSQIIHAQCISGDCNNGNGTYKYNNGDMYTGEWENGKLEGYGRYDWSDGSYYIGYFKGGLRQGQGKYVGSDGTKLEGTFVNGELANTSGCKSGDCQNGNGTYKFENGDLYTGEWKNGMRTGYGRYDWADGSYYIGDFRDNQLHGKGSYYAADGTSMIGTFENNNFVQIPNEVDNKTQDTSMEDIVAAMNAAEEDDKKALAEALTTAKRGDFCTVAQKVIGQFASNFENLRGPEQKGYLEMGSSWYANLMVDNSVEAGVTEALLSDSRTYYNILFASDDFAEARKKYDGFVNDMKNCNSQCCSLVSDTNDYKGDSYESYMTNWLTFLVNEGYDEDKYRNMVIEIELMSNVTTPKWSVVFRVYDLGDM